ncbi:uncharacterized protein ACN427_009236 isoform 1-T2 [Glossina fuscipes fuscipes]
MFKKFKFLFFFIIFFLNVISLLAKVDFVDWLQKSKTVSNMRNGMYFEEFSKNNRCVVISLVWYSASEDNGIHHQLGRIIITSWAPDFSHEKESRGYCVLGFDLTKELRDDQVIPWRTAVSADNRPAVIKTKADAKKFFKIALINLERSISFGKYIGDYKFATLPSVTQEKLNYENLPKTSVINPTAKLDAFLPFLHENKLKVARVARLHPDHLITKEFYGPLGKGAPPFWTFQIYFKSTYENLSVQSQNRQSYDRQEIYFYKRGNCAYKDKSEGTPIIYNDRLLGIRFYQTISGGVCTNMNNRNLYPDLLHASRVDLYANWINRIKDLMDEDNKKVQYSRLSPFVMFYGNTESKEVSGLLTFLGEKFAITRHVDNSTRENLRALPGIKRLVPPFDWSKGVAIAHIHNSNAGEAQLAIVELESEMNEGKYEIKLPTTLHPISGSRCEIMTILTEKTNREELTSRNNFNFEDDAHILHEVPVIPWDYRECRRCINELKENQFCTRLDGDIQNRNQYCN